VQEEGRGGPSCPSAPLCPTPTGPAAPLRPTPTGPAAPLRPTPTGAAAPLRPRPATQVGARGGGCGGACCQGRARAQLGRPHHRVTGHTGKPTLSPPPPHPSPGAQPAIRTPCLQRCPQKKVALLVSCAPRSHRWLNGQGPSVLQGVQCCVQCFAHSCPSNAATLPPPPAGPDLQVCAHRGPHPGQRLHHWPVPGQPPAPG